MVVIGAIMIRFFNCNPRLNVALSVTFRMGFPPFPLDSFRFVDLTGLVVQRDPKANRCIFLSFKNIHAHASILQKNQGENK